MATTTVPSQQQLPTTDIPAKHEAIIFPKVKAMANKDVQMKALRWNGRKSLEIASVSAPAITEDSDAIIRVTTAAICGSDLHLYHNEFAGMEAGDILGHEGVGIVEAVGPGVKTLKVGDRVVVSAVITCGQCYYCQNQFFSCCDRTNPSEQMEETYGHRTAGLFGYSHLTGGYDGLQAQFVRVPLADNNCLNVSASKLSDEKLVFLSDVLCTAWHANELGEVKAGDSVAIWGCGPVGLAAVILAKFRGAARIISIDVAPYRLEKAKMLGATSIINSASEKVLDRLKEIVKDGPDVCIDAVGFRFPKELKHKFMRALRLETDSPEVLRECIMAVRKAGRVSVIGDYYWMANMFPIGAFMEKGLQMRGGQVYVQKYWKYLLEQLESGAIDPLPIVTHCLPLERAVEGYQIFDKHQDGAIKVLLRPQETQA